MYYTKQQEGGGASRVKLPFSCQQRKPRGLGTSPTVVVGYRDMAAPNISSSSGGGGSGGGVFTSADIDCRVVATGLTPTYTTRKLVEHAGAAPSTPGFDQAVERLNCLLPRPHLLWLYLQHVATEEQLAWLLGYEGKEGLRMQHILRGTITTATVTRDLINNLSTSAKGHVWGCLDDVAAPLIASRRDKSLPNSKSPFAPAKTFIVDAAHPKLAEELALMDDDARPVRMLFSGRGVAAALISGFLGAPLAFDGGGKAFDLLRGTSTYITAEEGRAGLLASWVDGHAYEKNYIGTAEAKRQCLCLVMAARFHGAAPGHTISQKLEVRVSPTGRFRWKEDAKRGTKHTKRDAIGAVVRPDDAGASLASPSASASGTTGDDEDGEEEQEREQPATRARTGSKKRGTTAARSSDEKERSKRRRHSPSALAAIAAASSASGPNRFSLGFEDPLPIDPESEAEVAAAANGDGEQDLDLDVEDEQGRSERAKTAAERLDKIKRQLTAAQMQGALLGTIGLTAPEQASTRAAVAWILARLSWNQLLALYLDRCSTNHFLVRCTEAPEEAQADLRAALATGKPVGIVQVLRRVFDSFPLAVRRPYRDALRRIQSAHGAASEHPDTLLSRSSSLNLLLTPQLEEHIQRVEPAGVYINYMDLRAELIFIITSYLVRPHLMYDVRGRPLENLSVRCELRVIDGAWQGDWGQQQLIAGGTDGGPVVKGSCHVMLAGVAGYGCLPAFMIKDGQGIRLTANLEIRSLSAHGCFKYIIRDARLGRVVETVEGGQAACLAVAGRFWGWATPEVRADAIDECFARDIAPTLEECRKVVSHLDGSLQQFLEERADVPAAELRGLFKSLGQLKRYMAGGTVDGVNAGEAFAAWQLNDYEDRRGEHVDDGATLRKRSNCCMRLLEMDASLEIKADGLFCRAGEHSIARGLNKSMHDALLKHFIALEKKRNTAGNLNSYAHKAMTALGVTEELEDKAAVKAFFEAHEAAHDAHRFTETECGTVKATDLRKGQAGARHWAYGLPTTTKLVWPGPGRGYQEPPLNAAMSDELRRRFVRHLRAPSPLLEPGFEVVAEQALWAVGVRPDMKLEAVKKLLREGKEEHKSRGFTDIERRYWTTDLAMRESLKHMRECLGIE